MKWYLNENQVWETKLANGELVRWQGFPCGPICLTNEERAKLCEKLLQIDQKELKNLATESLQPVSQRIEKSLILHSTTPDLSAFKADLAKILENKQPKNYAGYTETRAVFLGKKGDLAVGRMLPWKIAAKKMELNMVEIPKTEYYYMSDALLKLAETHLEKPTPAIKKMVVFLQKYPHAVVRLYVLDMAIQIFLVWLKRQAGVEKIYIDANSPAAAATWNTKNILYPTVKTAQTMEINLQNTAEQLLLAERKENLLSKKLGLKLPNLVGYTLLRNEQSLADFEAQMLAAAQLLQNRYGLEKACLKAADSGDGARITPNIELHNIKLLKKLAATAYQYGDDYVLENNVYYKTTTFGTKTLKLTPSAHIRAGKVAAGITLQFTKGTSWIGNLFINEQLAPQLGISQTQYRTMRQTMQDFLLACDTQKQGLAIAGIDFAIGKIGGKFGETVLLGIQDPNISFNGAEFLRVFMQKTSLKTGIAEDKIFAATWVFVPKKDFSLALLTEILEKQAIENTFSTAIAVVPNFWAMIGVAATTYEQLLKHLIHLQEYLATFEKQNA